MYNYIKIKREIYAFYSLPYCPKQSSHCIYESMSLSKRPMLKDTAQEWMENDR